MNKNIETDINTVEDVLEKHKDLYDEFFEKSRYYLKGIMGDYELIKIYIAYKVSCGVNGIPYDRPIYWNNVYNWTLERARKAFRCGDDIDEKAVEAYMQFVFSQKIRGNWLYLSPREWEESKRSTSFLLRDQLIELYKDECDVDKYVYYRKLCIDKGLSYVSPEEWFGYIPKHIPLDLSKEYGIGLLGLVGKTKKSGIFQKGNNLLPKE